jgi:hypothetical protein
VDGADDKISSSLTSGPLAGVVYQGDLTGDGRPEVTILGPEATSSGSAVGKVWMFGASALDGGANLTVDDATRRFEGADEGAGFGSAAGRVEDMDGDGEAELIVGAPDGDSGTAYLFLSSSASAGVARLAADADAAWTGTAGGTDAVGAAFATGDFNSDGRGDVAVGAPGHSTATGAVYVMRGTATPTDGRIDSLRYSRLSGINTNDRCGTALAVGDTDNDGAPDLMIGAPNQVTQAGRVHIIPGEDITSGTDTVNDRSEVNHTGTTVYGHAGSSLASGGDVDGDGDDDLIVGGPGDSAGGDESGAAWLVLSGRTGDRALASADATFLGAADDDMAGMAVGMGDLNGDGLFDLAIGVPGEDVFTDEGAVYISLSGY